MRVAILWTRLSGYLNACLKELASREGVELFVSHQAPVQQVPFDDKQYAWIPNRLVWQSQADLAPLEEQLRAFDPEILVFSGWHVPAYRRMARELANRCWRVMAMDNCWMATLKQRMGTLIAPWYIRPLADRSGFPESGRRLLPGGWDSSSAQFSGVVVPAISRRLKPCTFRALLMDAPCRTRFYFVGRFVPEKGVDQLVKAYQLYREKSVDPWPLVCCGAGPLRPLLEGKTRDSRRGICAARPPVRHTRLRRMPGSAEHHRSLGGRGPRGGFCGAADSCI